MFTEYDLENLNKRFDRESQAWKDRYEVVEDSLFRYNDKLYRRHYTLELVGDGPGLALDLGCGAGSYFESLHRLGHQVVGVDSAARMITLANEEAKKLKGNGWVVRGGALNLPFADETFDSLLAVGLLEYLPNDREFLEGIARILKPGARVVITLRNSRCFERKLRQFYKEIGIDIYQTNYWYREHDPHEFDLLLKEIGFVNIESRFCHFYPFSWPLSTLLKPINSLFSNWMERRFSKSKIDWLASTKVVAFNKRGDHPKPQTLTDDTFSSILSCPNSGGFLTPASEEHLSALNAKIEHVCVKTKSGTDAEKMQAALISEDRAWIYPFIGKTPILAPDLAIPFSE